MRCYPQVIPRIFCKYQWVVCWILSRRMKCCRSNEIRAVTKSKRGLGNDKSAQDFSNGYRIYNNYVRAHTGLPEQQTPAAAAKIDLNLNQRNRLKDLIAKSAAQKEIAEGKFAVHLGERVQHVNIINEKDCIKVMLKGWLDKQVWKEINDILRVHQFAWLSNGKDSCWIRMMNGKE
jgi:hypothetical protein